MRRACLLAILVLLACDSAITEPEGPHKTGTIVARDVTIPIGGPPSVYVKDDGTEQCGGTVYLIRPKTSIIRREGGALVKASAAELAVGRRVTVWADVELRSCIAQSTADVIQILDDFGSSP